MDAFTRVADFNDHLPALCQCNIVKKQVHFAPVQFPIREELQNRGIRREAIDDLYELWKYAHAEAQELAARLPLVFGDPPRPGITLHVARGYDDEWFLSEERFTELSALDPEEHWFEVTADAAYSFPEYFTFSDSEGWRFYMPAFLRHYLAEFPLSRDDTVRVACEDRRHFDLFTADQVRFIDEFLALCRTWE